MEFWKELQARSYTLESLYAELKTVSVGDNAWVADEFEAIVRTTVAEASSRGESCTKAPAVRVSPPASHLTPRVSRLDYDHWP